MPTSRFEEERQALKAALARAFNDVRYPGDEGILAPDCLDDLDVADFRGGVWNADWRSVPAEIIERNYSSLLAFSPGAYRFFLPAYLHHALDAFWSDSSLVLPSLLYILGANNGPSDFRHRFYVQISLLTDDEKRVVCGFLEFVETHCDDEHLVGDAQRALNEYWRTGGMP